MLFGGSMDNIRKKKISIFSSIVIFVLAIVMTAALFLPTFKVGTYDIQASPEYYEGALTQYATPFGEVDVSPFIIIDIIKNYDDIYTILEIQTLEANMMYYSNRALELYASMENLSEEEKAAVSAEVDALVAKAGDANAELEKVAAEFDEARQLEISERLADEEFVTSLAFSHLLVRDYCKLFVEVDYSTEKQSLAVNVANFAELALLLVYALALPIWMLIFGVMIIIKLVIFIVRVISSKGEPEALPKQPSFPFISLSMTFFSVFVLLSCVSSLEFSIGLGLWIILAAALLSAFVKCVARALLNEKNVIDTLMNAGVCVAIAVMCVFLTMQFLNVDIINDFKLSTSEFGSVYASAQTDSAEEIAKAVGKANLVNTVKMFTISGVCLGCLLFAVAYFAKQLSNEGKKRKNAKRSVSRAGLIVCALVLAVALVPSFIGTESADTCFEKYQSGNYKMLWGAYKYNGMTVAANYSSYSSFLATCDSTIESIKEAMDSAEGEELESLERSYRETLNYKEITELKISRTVSDKKGLSSMCMAAAVALLVVQFIYTFIMHDDKKKDSEETLCEALDGLSETDDGEEEESVSDGIEVIETEETDTPIENEDASDSSEE